MNSKRKTGLKIALTVAAAAVIAVVVYFTSFHNADVLKIENGRVKGIKPTWLVGIVEENGKDVYVKLGDVGAPKGYKADSSAEDPDGDPITTAFFFKGKDAEKDPGTVLVEPWKGTLQQAAALEGASPCGVTNAKTEGEKDASCILVKEPSGETETLSLYLASPYEGACIHVQAALPAGRPEEELLELAQAAAAKVTPGKQLSPLAADFKLNFLDDNRWTYLLNGLLVTLEITLGAVVLGILIGVVVATVRSTWDQNSENMHQGPGKTALGFLNGVCKLYLTVIRGTPVVIQLMIMYYIIFSSSRNGVMIAMLSFGINSGAYVAEIIRGGIMSVDRGQLEAGRSLGFNYVQTMRHIIIPQAMKSVLPALANEFIVLLKETSVSGYVAVKDLTKGGDIIRGVTYSAFMPLLAVAAIYLVMVMFFTWLVGKLERRLRASDH
ncbi:MAG: amino acid ABC transporter permease [Clostridia bacterium]|nr:amino acid ABC transporter permease [Clostridia bacterium]